jgi:hypothetical protein
MPITLPCPVCGLHLKASDKAAGRTVNCPGCLAPVLVPGRAVKPEKPSAPTAMVKKTKTGPGHAMKQKKPPPPREEEIYQDLEVIQEGLDVLEEVPEEDDDIIDVLDEVDEDEPAPRVCGKSGLFIHGTNGYMQLNDTEVIIYHNGGSGFDPLHERPVRAGTYRHPLLSIADVELTPPGVHGLFGMIRFVLANEKRDPYRKGPIIDEQTITFERSAYSDFLQFKQEVERMRKVVLEEYRMRRG